MKGRRLIHAAAIADALSGVSRPGSLLLEDDRVIAAGCPESIGRVDAETVFLPRMVLLPALVNVHSHLDLTHLGPRAFEGSFMEWLSAIIRGRADSDDAVAASVRQGVELARAGGTGLLGDVAGDGSFAPIRALRESGMPGVSFLEVFGIGRGETDACRFIDRAVAKIEADASGVRFGLQPHAPYSCGRAVYDHAASLDVPLATHLAESLDEIEFTRSASGAFAEMLRTLRVWDETIQPMHAHPIDALTEPLSRRPWIAAHCNYVDDAHMEQLAQWETTVAYCPRASDFFHHPSFAAACSGREGGAGDERTSRDRTDCPDGSTLAAARSECVHDAAAHHRYREMIASGVRVALGTDSIVCLDRADRITTLDEMRHLYRRDGTDPLVLLHMSTVAGAEALGRDRSGVTFEPGETLGVIGLPFNPEKETDPLVQVMQCDAAPVWVVAPHSTRSPDTVIR